MTKPLVPDPENGNQLVNPVWSYGYDQYGFQTVVTDPKGRNTTNTSDAARRPLTRRLPMTQTESNVYNSLGQLWKHYDFKNQRTEYVHDRFGRVTAKFLFNAGATYPSNAVCYTFNTLDQLIRITERYGADATTNSCDGYAVFFPWRIPKPNPLQLQIARSMPYVAWLLAVLLIGFAMRSVPKEIWNALAQFYLRGGWRLDALDWALNRSKQRKLRIPSVNSVISCSNRFRLRLPCLFWRVVTLVVLIALIGNDPSLDSLFSARANCPILPPNFSTETTRITEMVYDLEGWLAQANSPEGVINYDYDLATGRLLSTCTHNSEVDYGYDELGRLKTVTVVKRNGTFLATPEVTTYTYTKLGSRETVTLPNKTISLYKYDSLNRLTNLTHTWQRQLFFTISDN